MNLNKILIEDKNKNYKLAKLTRDKTNLRPSRSKKDKIDPKILIQIGYSSIQTHKCPELEENYPPIGKSYKGHEKEFGKACLRQLIENTTLVLEQKKGNYILLKNLQTKNIWKYWETSAEVHYLKTN
jgi:hypothetical protein